MKRQTVRNTELQYAKLSGKDSDESGEECELFVRKPRRTHTEVPTVEKIIEEGDTLQSLSIRYQCPISELKRLNNIHKENEIYARTKIKLPARPFTMGIAGVHDSGNSSPTGGQLPAGVIDKDVLHKKLISTASSDEKLDFNKAIFNSNIVKPCDTTETALPSSEEEAEDEQLLPPVPEICTIAPPKSCSCSGADADISWIALIVCIVIVIFAVPVVYTLYIFEHPQEFHHQKHPQDGS